MNIPEQYLQALLEISREINSIQDREALLERILNIALQQLAAERGFILLRPEDGGALQPAAVENIDPDKISDISEISSTAVQTVIAKKQPILTYDTAGDEQFEEAPSVMLHKISSIACVPLLLKGELIGVIYIDSQSQAARLNQQSLKFLSAFANQAAIAIENARLMAELRSENDLLKEEFHRIYAFEGIVGHSANMEAVFQMIGKVLNNSATVLITGETGTGKELFARAIHYNGIRHERPFIAVNCAAIPEKLIESELYGYKKGAFTGANADKKGLIEMAHSGTIFLDEIAEIPPGLQVKLLRFLQEKEVLPVGGHIPVKVDVRVIAATNLNLEEEVQAGRFREDLYYRLQVIPVHIPPLRERTSDIPLLGHHFLKKCGEALGKKFDGFSKEALARLSAYQWPGNVRELENVIERAAVLAAGRRIEADDIVIKGLREVKGIEAGMTMEEVQRILLEKTLRACEGNKTRAAETMGVSLSWVHYKVKEWNIDA